MYQNKTNNKISHSWSDCRFLSCSVLPVRFACNCQCLFCFSKSSISVLEKNSEKTEWNETALSEYYRFAKERGATRLVITGGGEPLLRPKSVLALLKVGQKFFSEITCFTNGALLTRELSSRLRDEGLSYLCYSRHSEDDTKCAELMGSASPRLEDFFEAARDCPIRATCVMTKGYVDSVPSVWRYIKTLQNFGVTEFTFKHTYVAYEGSLFQSSLENKWAKLHQIEFDPFYGQGEIIASLPWGPSIRRIQNLQLCYYYEPSPTWELTNGICRSSNLLSDGKVYASLEEEKSFLHNILEVR